MTIAENTAVGVSGAIFINLLTVRSNATLYINNNQTLTVNGVLENSGTFLMASRDVNTFLTGTGRVDNAGLFQVNQVGGGGGSAQVGVPVEISATGRLFLAGAAWLVFQPGSSLTSAGSIEVENGLLSFQTEGPGGGLTLKDGAELGGGTIRFLGTNNVRLEGSVLVPKDTFRFFRLRPANQ